MIIMIDEHDPLCPDYKHPHLGDWKSCAYCHCMLIYTVREDERQKILGENND